MKKYLGLFFVLAMAFLVSAEAVQAVDLQSSTSGEAGAGLSTQGTSVNANGSVNMDGSARLLTPEQRQAKLDALIKAQADLQIRRSEMQSELKDKREAIRKEIEVKQGEMKSNIQAMREEGKQDMTDLRLKLKDEKDGVKAKIKELRINGREKALERFDAAIARVTNLKDKVNAAITRLSAKGVDVTKAQGFTATAEAKLTAAQTKTVEANAILSASINELTPENKAALKTLAQDIQNLIKDAHQALNDAVKALRDAVKVKMEASVDASATATTTNQ